MGNFVGHVIPGSMLILFGLWWSWGIAGLLRLRRRPPMRIALPPSSLGRPPLDPLLRLSLATIGICIEIHSAFGYPRLSVADIQHVTMYAVFGVAAAADLLLHYRLPLPKGADYALSCLSFLSEGLLFYFHIQHQGAFEQKIHGLLLVAVFGCFVATFLEAFYPDSLELKLHRSFWIIVQGTWFYQAAFLIYNPWPGSSHPWTSGGGVMEDSMWASIFFVAHLVFAVLLQVILAIPLLHPRIPIHSVSMVSRVSVAKE